MKKNLGRISLLLAVATWVFFVALTVGALDPVPYLRSAAAFPLLLALLSSGLAIIALALGPQRVSAGVALVLCVLLYMVYTGTIFPLLH